MAAPESTPTPTVSIPSRAMQTVIPLAHALQAVAAAGGDRLGLTFVEDFDQEGALILADPDAGMLGRRMAQHVGETLLHDAVAGVGDRRRYRRRGRCHVQLDGQSGPLDASDQVTQIREPGSGRPQRHTLALIAPRRRPAR